jgi:hypothetical protein
LNYRNLCVMVTRHLSMFNFICSRLILHQCDDVFYLKCKSFVISTCSMSLRLTTFHSHPCYYFDNSNYQIQCVFLYLIFILSLAFLSLSAYHYMFFFPASLLVPSLSVNGLSVMIVCHCLHLTMKFVCVSGVSVVRMPRNIINEMQRFRRNNRLTENNVNCCWTGQKQGNQLLQNMVSNTTQHLPPPPRHTLSAYTVLWHWERGMGGGRWTR